MISFIGNIFEKVRRRSSQAYHECRAALSLTHVSGPKRLSLGETDVVVVCLIKNGSFFIDYFLNYYSNLGVAHFVFVDNGSTDDTLKLAASRKNVTLIQSTLPAKHYENHLRRQAIRKFASSHWCLCVDSDELFDYPHSDKLSLQGLIGYLRAECYTCMVGQMLDMFSDAALGMPESVDASNLESDYPFYDLSSIESFDYHQCKFGGFDYFSRNNTVGSREIKWLFGGIRSAQFNAYVCLTKHPLFLVSPEMIPSVHPHCSSGVKCADISALIRHYKFAGDFHSRVKAEVENKTWETGEGEKYLRGLEQSRHLHLMRDTSRRFCGTDNLVRDRFLVTSARYEQWAAEHNYQREKLGDDANSAATKISHICSVRTVKS